MHEQVLIDQLEECRHIPDFKHVLHVNNQEVGQSMVRVLLPDGHPVARKSFRDIVLGTNESVSEVQMHDLLSVDNETVKHQEACHFLQLENVPRANFVVLNQLSVENIQDGKVLLCHFQIWLVEVAFAVEHKHLLDFVHSVHQEKEMSHCFNQKESHSVCFLADQRLFVLDRFQVFLLERHRLSSRKLIVCVTSPD